MYLSMYLSIYLSKKYDQAIPSRHVIQKNYGQQARADPNLLCHVTEAIALSHSLNC
jgi:hypothetical protein